MPPRLASRRGGIACHHGGGLAAAGLHRADQIDAVAHQILGGTDAGSMAADEAISSSVRCAACAMALKIRATSPLSSASPTRPPFSTARNSGPSLDAGGRDPGGQMPHGVGGDRRHLADAFLVGLAAPEGNDAEAVGVNLQVFVAQGDEFRASAQRRIGDGEQCAVAAMAQRIAGRREHAGHQHFVHRRRLGLSAAAFAVHAFQRQLDRQGGARIGDPGGAMEGRDAGDIAPHRRRRLETRPSHR